MKSYSDDLSSKLDEAFIFAQSQVKTLISKYPGFFPIYTESGKWVHEGESWTNWCEGFLGGIMWIFHKRTKDEWWREKAEQYSIALEERKFDRSVHDLGFIFWSTWKRWFDLYAEQDVKDVLITAGKTMGKRYMGEGGYLRSFVAPESLFIDIMMNVGIIFYAAHETKDTDLLQKVNQHCLTTRRYLVRGDGGTAHEGIFDLETGEFLRQSTHQGWRGDSTWARGLTWALYGFGTAYQMTSDYRYLITSKLCAEFFLEHTPFNASAEAGAGIPPNDYDDPRKPVLYDSSAAAIAASGLLNLSQIDQDPVYAYRYKQAALTILNTLTKPEYTAVDTQGWEGILKHGIYHQPKGLGVDESVMWGEYFYVEALDKAMSVLEGEKIE
jgi:unsaturated chondroitin disaccharide hydrolase